MIHTLAGRLMARSGSVLVMSVGVMLALSPGTDGLAQQPPTGPPVHIPSTERFTDEELSAFARAYPAVVELTEQQRSGQLERSAEEFSAARGRLIEKQGLSVEQYNRIVTAMNRDPRLRKRIDRLIDHAERGRSD